ncbi:MAG: hypothetical protein JWM52_85 [Candidatus Saccharibacteria bacterium]|nr:hypothetical protein [Candidatus Saccharibacteria bacterium]
MTDYMSELVYVWHERSKIDYADLYLRLYISYNAWFRKATQASVDKEAIAVLKKRFIIWDDYLHGRILNGLEETMLALKERGFIQTSDDWPGLISFWYQIRCDLFHGLLQPHDDSVRFAYESLSIFMDEIVKRMKQFNHQGSFFTQDVWHVDMERVIKTETLYSS